MIAPHELGSPEEELPPRILVVEGQATRSGPSNALITTLLTEGYDVEVAVGVSDCVARFTDPPALVVLATLGPDTRWTDVCRAIRTISDVPILIGTRPDSELEAVLAFELGVWGYLSNATRTRELSARVRAALRMSSALSINESTSEQIGGDNSSWSAGPLEIDVVGRAVKVGGRSVHLPRLEFDLLVALMSPPGVVRTKRELIEHVWHGKTREGSRTLDTHIRRLRLKLEFDPARPQFLMTVRGIGFRLDAERGTLPIARVVAQGPGSGSITRPRAPGTSSRV